MQRENKWQDRFDEEFKYINFLDSFEDIKSFIQSEIDLAVKEERERISKLLS